MRALKVSVLAMVMVVSVQFPKANAGQSDFQSMPRPISTTMSAIGFYFTFHWIGKPEQQSSVYDNYHACKDAMWAKQRSGAFVNGPFTIIR